MHIAIKHRLTDAVLFEGEYESLRECVKAAVKARANLARAYLARAYLAGAYLTDADLTGAYLARAYLTGADLTGAYLARAYLTGADLTGADLTGADLTGADLTDADLTGAYLTDADLAGADLTDADLTGADLARAKNVGETNGSEASTPTQPYQRDTRPRKERDADRAQRFRERNPDVPVVEALDAKILKHVETGAGILDMSTWHGPDNKWCGTTHCRAGWAIHEAGPAGKALQDQYGPQRAGAMIYRASTGRVPHFFASTERALEDIRACAAEQS